MKFGLAFASSVGTDPSSAIEIAKIAEAVGFESVWGLIWLAYVAAAAPTLRLGTCILILPQRNPLVLAKELATLDHLSGGRVELGIGVGWLEEEFVALGVPLERRGRRNDEYVEVLRTIWSGSHVQYHGEFVDFEPLTSTPQPTQGADIPILVGGDTPVAVRRAARLADGYFPGESNPERLGELITSVRAACKDQDLVTRTRWRSTPCSAHTSPSLRPGSKSCASLASAGSWCLHSHSWVTAASTACRSSGKLMCCPPKVTVHFGLPQHR